MRKVLIYSILLVVGLVGSQALPAAMGERYHTAAEVVALLTMVALSFIMIHVGYEFEIDKGNLRQYGWDYVVAATAAGFPWIFCAVYFIFVLAPPEDWGSWLKWKEALLEARFAAPTSAGVLFSMLAAAGLAATWMFRKARVLAIFDDLDTVLFMIPLQALMVGARWQLGVVVLVMGVLLWLAWRHLHAWRIPITWPWVLGYSLAIVAAAEAVYLASKYVDEVAPIHIEVLLPAFVLGCLMARPRGADPHRDDAKEGHEEGPESEAEQRVATMVSAAFMVLVGLSMPALTAASGSGGRPGAMQEIAGGLQADDRGAGYWGMVAVHVLLVTAISNLGKMFPALCYRKEAHWRARLALAVAMFPRGEVGAGVLVISISYGIGGLPLTVAMLSLALNLVLTGLFIVIVKRLLTGSPSRSGAGAAAEETAAGHP